MIPDREELRRILRECGAVAVGFGDAAPAPVEVDSGLRSWIDRGDHAGMDWMRRHADLRRDPSNVLPGVRSIISLAFPYAPVRLRDPRLPYISTYAYGDDYHFILRRRILSALSPHFPEESFRICIDSAPVEERYRALRTGIGVRGDNGMVIIPGTGAEVFLSEIFTTLEYAPDPPSEKRCLRCGACRRACPTGALHPDGTIDCRRCISYLSIEHRGPWTDPESIGAMHTDAGRHTLFGCDACVRVCPMNRRFPDLPDEPLSTRETLFPPREEILTLTGSTLPPTSSQFRRRFAGSALLRAGLDGLRRNLDNLTD